ncbi:MAG: class I adenylate-forming enzyme family protein [Oscillospiraceae bacterium]
MIKKPNAPWLENYGDVPTSVDYPDITMYDRIAEISNKYADSVAYNYMKSAHTYAELLESINQSADSFAALGIKRGDRVVICAPNMPQAVFCMYGLNKLGAVAVMIHPLSSEGEINFFVKDSKCVAAVAFDGAYEKFCAIRDKNPKLKTVIVSTPVDTLSSVMKVGYKLTQGRKFKSSPIKGDKSWRAIAKNPELSSCDPAIVLYSGGTTGTSKGILLSNLNLNGLAFQIIPMANCFVPGDAMLAVMPMFHGFGLGVGIHTFFASGGRVILVPRFNVESYSELIKTLHPNFIAGVPTLFENMLQKINWDGTDLGFLKGVFSGGDSLSVDLKHRFDKFLSEHGASVKIREGYGTTECVTASCLTPYNVDKDNCIGFPFPDTFYKIVGQNTTEELPFGYDGEICISGPTVMIEYINQPQETASTLRMHADGRIWLHTGDLGMMDSEGFVYFKQRIKRMIISSGYNIYPSQLENVIDEHESVHLSCVIGVPDPIKQQRVKAFVVLMPGVEPNEATKAALTAYLKKNIAKYMLPYDIEFRDSLPKTLVGKVAYTVLEAQEAEKRKKNGEKE